MRKLARNIITMTIFGFAMLVGAQANAALTAVEVAKLIYGDGQFGWSVAVDGDTAVIGARSGGSAFVYIRDDAGSWIEQDELTLGNPGDAFGYSVAVDGDTVVIGDRSDNSAAGSAYVYTRNDLGVWTQQGNKLIASNPGRNHLFGESIALDGSTVIIGAIGATGNATGTGSAYVFTRNDLGVWTQQGNYLIASDGVRGDLFGVSVALDGNTAAIGASKNDDKGMNAGAAYVYIRDDSGDWTEQAKLTASDGTASDQFGVSVAIDGPTALIGAGGNSQDTNPGSAYVFTKSGGVWSEETKLSASDGAVGDLFGSSVALDGNTAVIGAERDDVYDDNGNVILNAGSAYVFSPVGCGGWSEQARITASDGAADDAFGGAVALDGNTAVIGAPQQLGSSVSKAYVFALGDAGPITSEVQADPNPAAVYTDVVLTATVDASSTSGLPIASASYSIDGVQYKMDADDGAFDEVMEEVKATVPAFSAAGLYTIEVTGIDSDNNTGAPDCVELVVYDRDDGFVTGNGRIDSPAGAYAADPTVTGKAIFGIDAKYKMGAITPSGSTQFRFKAGDLKFSSHDYEWLVVDGARALYQGVGTIGGTGNYGFRLSVIDDALEPATTVDLFRIRIWDRDNGNAVVYDNEMGAAEDADPTTPIISGSIVVHTN